MDQMAACCHYRHWRTDLQLVRGLGLRYLHYGPPLHLNHRDAGQYDWTFLDEVFAKMQRLGIAPIMDLCHFGLPDWLQNFQNPEVPLLVSKQSLFHLRLAAPCSPDWIKEMRGMTCPANLFIIASRVLLASAAGRQIL